MCNVNTHIERQPFYRDCSECGGTCCKFFTIPLEFKDNNFKNFFIIPFPQLGEGLGMGAETGVVLGMGAETGEGSGKGSESSFPPAVAVKAPVLNRFGKVFGADIFLFVDICNGSGNLEDAIECAG